MELQDKQIVCVLQGCRVAFFPGLLAQLSVKFALIFRSFIRRERVISVSSLSSGPEQGKHSGH